MSKLPHVDVYYQANVFGEFCYYSKCPEEDQGHPISINNPKIQVADWTPDEIQAIADHMLLSEKAENKYVVGFCFNEERDRVALIQKKRPSWQEGLWNGIGGRIETVATDVYETPLEAMRREFLEETGIEVASWLHAITLVMENKHVYVFRAFDNRVEECSTQTDEEVQVWNWKTAEDRHFSTLVPNVRWFLPMLTLDHYRYPIVIRDVVNPERIKQDTADPKVIGIDLAKEDSKSVLMIHTREGWKKAPEFNG